MLRWHVFSGFYHESLHIYTKQKVYGKRKNMNKSVGERSARYKPQFKLRSVRSDLLLVSLSVLCMRCLNGFRLS